MLLVVFESNMTAQNLLKLVGEFIVRLLEPPSIEILRTLAFTSKYSLSLSLIRFLFFTFCKCNLIIRFKKC